jgi:hypothetical protein
MTIEDRHEIRNIIEDAAERFGWWEVLWECQKGLREAWETSPANPKAKKLQYAASLVEDAAKAIQ